MKGIGFARAAALALTTSLARVGLVQGPLSINQHALSVADLKHSIGGHGYAGSQGCHPGKRIAPKHRCSKRTRRKNRRGLKSRMIRNSHSASRLAA